MLPPTSPNDDRLTAQCALKKQLFKRLVIPVFVAVCRDSIHQRLGAASLLLFHSITKCTTALQTTQLAS